MLTRIVVMTFQEDKVEQFLQLFNSQKHKIRAYSGCHHLELWKDHRQEHVFSTYSIWENQEALEGYRTSPLFKEVWSQTKVLFKEKAQAFSMTKFMEVNI